LFIGSFAYFARDRAGRPNSALREQASSALLNNLGLLRALSFSLSLSLSLIVPQDVAQFDAARSHSAPFDVLFSTSAISSARSSTRAFGFASSSRDFNWNFQLFAGNLVPLDGT